MPNILLVSGNGKDVGKTALACKIIQRSSAIQPVVSVKISDHFHELTAGLMILENNSNFIVALENDTNGHKDSSKFLKAGATSSYYIQSKENCMLEAFSYVADSYDENQLFILESGSLGKYVKPGVSLFVKNTQEISSGKEYRSHADEVLDEKVDFGEFAGRVIIENNSWFIDMSEK